MIRYVDPLEFAHTKSLQYVIHGDEFMYLNKLRSNQLKCIGSDNRLGWVHISRYLGN